MFGPVVVAPLTTLIMGAYNRSAIATVFDGASRYLWLADMPEGHGVDATLAALVETLERRRLPCIRCDDN